MNDSDPVDGYTRAERTRGRRFLSALAGVAAILADRLDDAPPLTGVAVHDVFPPVEDGTDLTDYRRNPTPLITLHVAASFDAGDAADARRLVEWGEVLSDVSGNVTSSATVSTHHVNVAIRAVVITPELNRVLVEAWGQLSDRVAARWWKGETPARDTRREITRAELVAVADDTTPPADAK